MRVVADRISSVDRLIKNLSIDDRLESYRDFFSDDWGHRVAALVKDAPRLQRLTFELMADWRGAAYTVSFPAQMLEHFRSFAEGFTNDPEPNTGTLRFADVVLTKLRLAIPELTADSRLQRVLHEKLVALTAEIKEAHSKVQIEFPIDDIWKQYLRHHVYQITLWSTLRIGYVAIYNAYDNFVQQCTSLARAGERIRTTGNTRFKRKFCETFGEPAYQQCWESAAVNVARLTRHALSHAAGRPSERLLSQSPDLCIEDGVIHILPIDIKELYATLKDAALALCAIAKNKPELRTTE